MGVQSWPTKRKLVLDMLYDYDYYTNILKILNPKGQPLCQYLKVFYLLPT